MQPLRKQVEAYLAETDWDEWVSIPDDFENVEMLNSFSSIHNPES